LDFIVAAIVAFIVSLIVCRALIAAGPIDTPTETRKQEIHNHPTPTSGGLGISAGFGAGMVALSLASFVWRQQVSEQGVALIWLTASFAYPLVVIGFIDDTKHLSAPFKFAVYALLSLAASWMFGVVNEVRVGDVIVNLPFAAGLIGTALWVFTLINAVNFMDGANGLSMGSVAVGLAALSIIAFQGGALSAAAVALCGAGALLGFVVWNYPAGKLFAGDSGALFAGALAAFACLIAIGRMDMSPLVAPILFFPLLADVLLTLYDRVRRGRSLMVGHTEHLYQLAIHSGWSHARIAVAYWLAMLACGAIGIAVAQDPTHTAPCLALIALAVISLIVNSAIRRTCVERGVLRP
jgi:Fuc2NAc and GlcNAc transferase